MKSKPFCPAAALLLGVVLSAPALRAALSSESAPIRLDSTLRAVWETPPWALDSRIATHVETVPRAISSMPAAIVILCR